MENHQVVSPQQSFFKTSAIINKWYVITEITAFVVAMSLGVISQFNSSKVIDCLAEIFSVTSIVLAIILFGLKNRNSYYFEKAQVARRCGFFDNSFDCRTAASESKSYYDNDDVTVGIKRLLANLHENCIFTGFISNKMFNGYLFLLVIILLIVLYLLYVGFRNSVWGSLLLNASLFYNFLEYLCSLNELKTAANQIEEKCRSLWSHIGSLNLEDVSPLEPQILEIQTEYDVLLSTTKIHLSRKLKEANNPALMKTWDEYKQRFILRA